MLCLIIIIEDNYFALDAENIIEIIPLVNIKKIPGLPDLVTGIFNYRGLVVPVIDLTFIITGRRASELMSTRIIVVNYQNSSGEERKLGLIAEEATVTERFNVDDFELSRFDDKIQGFIGSIALRDNLFYQKINLNNLISEDIETDIYGGIKNTVLALQN
jgi:chemotaxis-related protein WspB